MKALLKTLFGSFRTVAVGAAALALATIALHGPMPVLAGLIFPAVLLGGAGYLARH
jgi:hypothetical protein